MPWGGFDYLPNQVPPEQMQMPTAPANRLAALMKPRQTGVGGGFGIPGAGPGMDQTIINGPNAATYNRNAAGSITGGAGLSGPAAGMSFSNPAQREAFENFVNSGSSPGAPGGPVGGLLQNYGRMFGAGLGVDPTGGLLANNPESRDAFLKFAQGQQGLGLQGGQLGLERAKLDWEKSPHKLLQDLTKGMAFQGMAPTDISDFIGQVRDIPGLTPSAGFSTNPNAINPHINAVDRNEPPPDTTTKSNLAPADARLFKDWLRKATMPLDPSDKTLTAKRIFKTTAGTPMDLAGILSKAEGELPPGFLGKNFGELWPQLTASSGLDPKEVQSFLSRVPDPVQNAFNQFGRWFTGAPRVSLEEEMRSKARNALGYGMPNTEYPPWLRAMQAPK